MGKCLSRVRNRARRKPENSRPSTAAQDDGTAIDDEVVNEYILLTFGPKKNQYEEAFVKALNERKSFSFIVLILAFASFLAWAVANLQTEQFRLAMPIRHRCYIKDLESTNFTYEQKLAISLDKNADPYGQHCYYYNRDFKSLLKRNKNNFSAIITETETVNISDKVYCKNTVKQSIGGFIENIEMYKFAEVQYNLFCDRKHFAKWLWKSYSYGTFLGTIPFCVLGDLIGRTKILRITTTILFISFVITNIPGIWFLMIGRFLTGLVLVPTAILLYVLFLESCNIKSRNYLGYAVTVGDGLGQVLQYFCHNFESWQICLLVYSTPFVIYGIIVWTVSESVRWLYFSDHKEQALKLINKPVNPNEINAASKRTMTKRLKAHFTFFILPTFKRRILLTFSIFFLLTFMRRYEYEYEYEIFEKLKIKTYMMIGSIQILIAIPTYVMFVFLQRNQVIFILFGIESVMNLLLFLDALPQACDIYFTIVQRGMSANAMGILFFMITESYPTTQRCSTYGIALLGHFTARIIVITCFDFPYDSPVVIHYMPSLTCSLLCALLAILHPDTRNRDIPDKPRDALPSRINIIVT